MAEKITGITIQVNGDVSEFQKSLKALNKETSSLNSELSKVNQTAKFNPNNAKLMGQQIELVGKQVSLTEDKLKKLKEAEQELIKSGRNNNNDEVWRKLQTEIVATESKLEHYKGQLNELTKSQSKLNEVIQKTGEGLEKTGGKMKDNGKTLSKYVTAPTIGLGVAAGGAWKEYDDAIDGIITATGATGDKVKGFEKVYKKVFGDLPVESSAVSGAIGELNTQFGFTEERLQNSTEYMLKFSEITGSDVVASTQGAKKAIELYGLESSDLEKVLDRVAKVSQDTGLSTDKIFAAVQKGAPQIKALGLSFDEGATLIGKFEKSGIDSTKALSYLGKATVEFAKEGKSLQSGLSGLSDELGRTQDSTQKLTILAKYFGTKGAPFMLEALESGALSLDELSKSAEDAGGTVDKTFKEILDPPDKFRVIMNKLKTTLADFASVAYEMLAPMIDKVAEKVQQFTDWVSNLNEGQKQTILKILAITAAIGPLLVILGTLFEKMGSAMKGFSGIGSALGKLASPVSIAVAVIGALVGAFVIAYNKSETFRNKMNEIGEKLKNFVSNVVAWVKETLIPALKEFWENLKEFIDASVVWVRDTLIPAVQNLWDKLKEFWETFLKPLIEEYIMPVVEQVVEFIKSAIENYIIPTIEKLGEIFKQFIQSSIEWIKNDLIPAIKNLWDNLKKFWETFLKPLIVDHIIPLIKSFVEFIKTTIETVIIPIIKVAVVVIGGLIKAMAEVFLWIWNKLLKPLIEGIVNFVKNNLDLIKNIFGGVIDAISAIFKTFSALFKGDWEGVWNGIKEYFESIWTALTSYFKLILNAIWEVAKKVLVPLGKFFANVWNKIKQVTESVWNAIKGFITGIWEGISSTVSKIVNGISETISKIFNGIKDTVTTIWEGIKTAIVTPIEKAKEIITGIIDKIKGLFSFKFEWPHIPLPHFNFSGSINPFSGDFPPKLSVDWYAQGGIFKTPKIIGVGENGPEAVLPTHKLDKFLDEAVARVSGGNGGQGDFIVNINNPVVREDTDIEKIRREIEKIYRRTARGGAY